jgi:hypothetical protein
MPINDAYSCALESREARMNKRFAYLFVNELLRILSNELLGAHFSSLRRRKLAHGHVPQVTMRPTQQRRLCRDQQIFHSTCDYLAKIEQLSSLQPNSDLQQRHRLRTAIQSSPNHILLIQLNAFGHAQTVAVSLPHIVFRVTVASIGRSFPPAERLFLVAMLKL